MCGIYSLAYDKAKRYSSRHYTVSLIETSVTILFLFVLLRSGSAGLVAGYLAYFQNIPLVASSLYLFVLYLAYYIVRLPFTFYSSFVLEHAYALSREKLSHWFLDQLKGFFIFYCISLICMQAFYFALQHMPGYWWVSLSVFWVMLSLVFARLMPTVIIPLFFKYERLNDESLRQKIVRLAQKMHIAILDVCQIDFSKKTLKANAAFVGWGATRRVLLADTLQDKYTQEEIEVILAHEFAHYQMKHLLKLIAVGSAGTAVSFYLLFKTHMYFLGLLKIDSLLRLEALPLVGMYIIVLGILLQPWEHFVSRVFERQADREAIRVTGLRDAFISAMEKLAAQNLSDRMPHPLIKFFFFDHPPIDERIAMAESLFVNG